MIEIKRTTIIELEQTPIGKDLVEIRGIPGTDAGEALIITDSVIEDAQYEFGVKIILRKDAESPQIFTTGPGFSGNSVEQLREYKNRIDAVLQKAIELIQGIDGAE